VNKKGNVLVSPMHVRKGDTVQVIAGKDKGKVGEVTKARAQRPLPAPCRPLLTTRAGNTRWWPGADSAPHARRCCQSTARWWWRA